MYSLQEVAIAYGRSGWSITSLTDEHLIVSRPGKKPGWAIFVAIFFFPIGLLALLIQGSPITEVIVAAQAENAMLLLNSGGLVSSPVSPVSPEQVAANRRRLKRGLVVGTLAIAACVLLPSLLYYLKFSG